MRSQVRLVKTALEVVLALTLGLSLWSCGGATPSTPTHPSAGPINAQAPAASGSLLAPTTTWSCLTAGSVGIFASARACAAPRVAPLAQGRVFAAAAPGPAFNLSGAVTGSTVTLTWLGPTSPPATSYVIEAGSSPGASNLASFDTGNPSTTLTVTGVPAGTYYVRVRAKNSDGLSAPSNEIILTVGGGPGPCAAPGAPTGLTAPVNGSTVTLTWQAPTSGCAPTTYVIEAGSSSGLSNLAAISTGNTVTSFTATNVPAGTYYVRVRAGAGTTSGPASNEVVVTVATAPPPGCPVAVAGTVTGCWLGLVSNGDGVTPPDVSVGGYCGVEKYNLQLTLTQNPDGTVTGTETTTAVIVSGRSGCTPLGQVSRDPVNGSVVSGTVRFTIYGVGYGGPELAVGTFTGSRMSGSTTPAYGGGQGTFAVNRQ